MQIGEMKIVSELVDNQVFYVPNSEQWETLLKRNPIVNGKYIVYEPGKSFELMLKLDYNLLKFTQQYSEFSLAFYEISSKSRSWFKCVILRVGDKWQRVNIGGRTCKKCGWNGLIADPTGDMSIYVGSPEKEEAFKRACKISSVPCPRCNSQLPGHIIWVENNN